MTGWLITGVLLRSDGVIDYWYFIELPGRLIQRSKKACLRNSPLLLKEGWHDEGVTGWLITGVLLRSDGVVDYWCFTEE